MKINLEKGPMFLLRDQFIGVTTNFCQKRGYFLTHPCKILQYYLICPVQI